GVHQAHLNHVKKIPAPGQPASTLVGDKAHARNSGEISKRKQPVRLRLQIDENWIEFYRGDLFETEQCRRQNVPPAADADDDTAFAARQKIAEIGDVVLEKLDVVEIPVKTIGRRAGVAVDEQIHLFDL